MNSKVSANVRIDTHQWRGGKGSDRIAKYDLAVQDEAVIFHAANTLVIGGQPGSAEIAIASI